MNVLCIDTDGVGLAFCWRSKLAGHSVRWFVKEKPTNCKELGDGFGIEKIQNWVSSIKWADLVFVTGNDDYLKRLDFFRSNGSMVFGPSEKSANLEIKRAEGMKFLQDHGIEIAPYKTFKSLSEAESHVRKTEERYVFKTLGDNEDKSLSYCSKSPADMISRLQYWQKNKMNPKGEVMLQTFIEGIEMGVSRWMGTKGFIGSFDEHFEHKKLMPGNCGPNTGEMGTCQAYTKESKLGSETLMKMEEDLLKMDSFGDIALGFIIDEKGKPWPTEFTVRPGWPAFNIMLSQHKEPCKWMLDAMRGKDSFETSEEVAIGIVIAQPPFPFTDEDDREELKDIPFYGVTKKNSKYIQPQGLKIKTMPDMEGLKVKERPIWSTVSDYLAVVTGVGETVSKASQRAYKTAEEIYVPNCIKRNDVGLKLKEQLPKLHALGYAKAFNY